MEENEVFPTCAEWKGDVGNARADVSWVIHSLEPAIFAIIFEKRFVPSARIGHACGNKGFIDETRGPRINAKADEFVTSGFGAFFAVFSEGKGLSIRFGRCGKEDG